MTAPAGTRCRGEPARRRTAARRWLGVRRARGWRRRRSLAGARGWCGGWSEACA